MTRVLLTGATGYVGQEVLRQLLAHGHQVTALGRTDPQQGVAFLQADLADRAGVAQALDGHSCDWLLHTASLPGDTGDPEQMVDVNVAGCLHLLEFARRTGVERFVLDSSISAYEWYPATQFSPPDYMPVDEQHPCRPRDMYSTTKYMQEQLALTYYHQYKVPTTVLRLTAVIGPRGRGGGRGWREIAQQLAAGERVQVPHFSAQELCHYVDYRDVGRMHLAVAVHPNAVGQIFNCCGPAPTRGAEFVEIVQELVPGIQGEYGFPWSMAQGGEIAFDMSKASRLLDFTPLYSLRESMQSIVDWIKQGGLEENGQPQDPAFGGGVQTA